MFENLEPEDDADTIEPDSFATEDYNEGDEGWKMLSRPQEEYDILDEYEPFNPEKRLEEIKKLDPSAKERAIKQFKRNLRWQRFVGARLYEEIAQTLASTPDTSQEDIIDIVESAARDGSMTGKQIQAIHQAVENYFQRRTQLKEVREKYDNDTELFEYIAGEEPTGEVEVKMGSATLYIRCFSDEDYNRIYNLEPEASTDGEDNKAEKSGGVSLSRLADAPDRLSGAITVERAKNHTKQQSQITRQHEEEHGIQKLLRSDIYPNTPSFFEPNISGATSKEEVKSATEQELAVWLEGKYYPRMKDEILAYMKTGDDNTAEDVYNILTKKQENGGVYWPSLQKQEEVAAKIKKTLTGNDAFVNEAKTIVHEQLHKTLDHLDDVIRQGVQAYTQMREYGYSDHQISLILMSEPLERWSKAADRMT